jgi:hypothetical protein
MNILVAPQLVKNYNCGSSLSASHESSAVDSEWSKTRNGLPCNDSSCGWLEVLSSVSSFTYNSPLQSIVSNAEGNWRARMTQLLCVTSIRNPLYIPHRYSVPTLLVLYLYPHPAILLPTYPPSHLSSYVPIHLRVQSFLYSTVLVIPSISCFVIFVYLLYLKRWKSIMRWYRSCPALQRSLLEHNAMQFNKIQFILIISSHLSQKHQYKNSM